MKKKKRAIAKYGICQDCGMETSISQKGLCSACSLSREIKTVKQLREGKGEKYKKWKEGMLRAMWKKEQEKREEKKC